MVKILWHRTAVRDGWHNAFTDLCLWRDTYWLTYRRGSAHRSPDGGIVVLRSVDLERWQEMAFINTGGDDRDPKLCPVGDKLNVYFGTWLRWPYELGSIVSHVSTTQDGFHWSKPVQVYKQNYWLWRVRIHEGTFYCPEKGGELLTSLDGLNWTMRSRIPTVEDEDSRSVNHRPCSSFNEADLIFRPNGEVWCISRTERKPDHSLFYV